MEIQNLITNNVRGISQCIPTDVSIGIGGLSGSGKTSFCSTLSDESIKRIVTILPKSEYRFLFGNRLISNYSSQNINKLPLVFYLGKSGFASNPRSTVGTHTGVFREIREKYAETHNKVSEFFSFNNSIMWCNACKGRGSTSGNICTSCNGNRYTQDVRKYTIKLHEDKYDITEINSMSAEKLISITTELGISESKKNILQNMIDLDIGYLSLDRIISTLSGGENVRLLLAEFMAQCVNSLVIIDEVSIGLDRGTLVNVIEKISRLGKNNQIWLIDHSDIVLSATDTNIYFGPGSGKEGGEIVDYSPRPEPIYRTINSTSPQEYYVFENMQKRNLDIGQVLIPKNRVTTITGESGCGKSTLVNECILSYLSKKYKHVEYSIIGQDRNQSITSKSTIATFLDIRKKIDVLCACNTNKELTDIRNSLQKDKQVLIKIDMLIKLGLGYLTLDRKVQTLSTGEFQCLHLVSKLTEKKDRELLLIFDEPSKGLSQNILNLLIQMFDDILRNTKNTILIIEHNSYILKCSDFILDFGKRKINKVTELTLYKNETWLRENPEEIYSVKLSSKLDATSFGEKHTIENIDEVFNQYENKFKGGLLKKLSPTAQWIYDNYESDIVEPVIVIDLEKNIYSKNTFLYEISGLVNNIIAKSKTTNMVDFDFYSRDNLCECCKGTGKITTIDFNIAIKNDSKGIWDGLLEQDVMKELKRYNYSKIKFLLKQIEKETGFNLEKSYHSMTEEERNLFLYGYWKSSFYDKNKKTQRKWKGIVHLIIKYMKTSKSPLKDSITNSKKTIICPVCKGTILGHEKELLIEDVDIRDIIVSPIKDVFMKNPDIPILKELMYIIDENISLNSDVSELSKETQVKLKINEIKNNNFFGFTVVLKNVAPFKEMIYNDIKQIAQNNRVIVLDYLGINNTKQQLLDRYFSKGKIKPTSYVYELLGYKKINTQINKIRKLEPCQYCSGKKVLREENIFEGVDITETPCHSCKETGISDLGLELKIDGISIRKWILGHLSDIDPTISNNISNIPPMSKINELNKQQIYNVYKYLEENHVII